MVPAGLETKGGLAGEDHQQITALLIISTPDDGDKDNLRNVEQQIHINTPRRLYCIRVALKGSLHT